MQPYPPRDNTRINRILADVADLLHQPYTLAEYDATITLDARFERSVRRWVTAVLGEIASRRRWWWTENLTPPASLAEGQDLVDLVGDLAKVIAVFAPTRARKVPLAHVAELRSSANSVREPNAAAICTHYALEGGRRLHLWPAPSGALDLQVLYTRPMDLEILPADWERIVVDGVIGRYGRHYDRDALTQDAASFELRFEAALMRAASDSWDVERVSRWDPLADSTAATPGSSTDTAVTHTIPASLEGIGSACIYVLEVVP